MVVNRERKLINVAQESSDFNGRYLKDIADRVDKLIEIYGPTATIDEYSGMYDESTYQYVWSEVLETNEQMAARIKQEELYDQLAVDRERKEFERLKAKFG